MAKRTQYALTSQNATLSDFGRITPFLSQEVAPGDTWSGNVGALIRLSPLKKAMLQDVYVDMFVFYIPHRLVYANWEDFIAEGPMDTPTYSTPSYSVSATNTAYNSLFQVANGTATTTYSALPLYGLNLCYNEFFRDDEDAVRNPTDTPGQYGIEVNWKKDYWSTIQLRTGYAQQEHYFSTNVGSGTQASAQDVLDALARQKVAMKRATYGSRYIDILRSMGINVNYQMLQRPEVVAVARSSINVTDVVQTSAATGNLGDLAGHGISGSRIRIRRKSFPEHGRLLGVALLRPVMSDSKLCEWFDRPRTYENYYDPGLITLPPVNVAKQDAMPCIASGVRTNLLGYQPWGEWYRHALSRKHLTLSSTPGYAYADFTSASDISRTDLVNMQSSDFDSIFADTSLRHWQGSFVNKMRVKRRIPKTNLGALLNV